MLVGRSILDRRKSRVRGGIEPFINGNSVNNHLRFAHRRSIAHFPEVRMADTSLHVQVVQVGERLASDQFLEA